MRLCAALSELSAQFYVTDAEGLITYYNLACIALAGGTPILGECSSSGNLRLIRLFEKRGSGSSGLEFKRPAVGAASDGLRWWRV
jgi:hypothetical protein